MPRRTLRLFAVFALLVLTACSAEIASTADAGPATDPGGWRLSSGKLPTKAEFAALAATCEAKGGAVDGCLADLGLKRAK
jgi:outer membrane biogenesis lipoprotein LolB